MVPVMTTVICTAVGVVIAPMIAITVVWLWGAGALSSHDAWWQIIGCAALLACMIVMAVTSYKEIMECRGRKDALYHEGPVKVTGHVIKNTYRQYVSSVFAPISPYFSVVWQQVMIATPLGRWRYYSDVRSKEE